MTLTVKVAVMPEVKIGNYNGLTVEKTVHTVTDESVDAELKRVQERNARELTREVLLRMAISLISTSRALWTVSLLRAARLSTTT